ncbi:MAG: hypothetical protein MN733_11460 [Nitrososphaera sp.]|nr:hypothetical protein [Nitrososphaera sp.]
MKTSESAWWEDSCKTWDEETHDYSATESLSAAGTSVRITFTEYGSFTSYSEEDAIEIFQKWYKKNVKAPEDDLRDPVRKPPIRNGNRNV